MIAMTKARSVRSATPTLRRVRKQPTTDDRAMSDSKTDNGGSGAGVSTSPSKALLALVELWDLMIDVPEQNAANWDQSLAEQQDAALTEAWGILLRMEDEITACKANAENEPRSEVE